MPVEELLARTSSLELAEWQAYEQECGPLGPERGDWQAALMAHTFAAVSLGKKGRRLKISDFLLRFGRRSQRQSGEEMLTMFRALAARQKAAAAAESEETRGHNR